MLRYKISISAFILLCLCGFNTLAQNIYKLSFNLDNAVGHKFYLLDIYGGLKNGGNRIPIDSIQATSDTFSFRGSFNETQYFSLAMDSSEYFRVLIIDTGGISIQGSADNFLKIRVRNSWQNDVERLLGTSTNPLVDKLNDYASKSETEKYDSIFNDLLDSILVFTKLYPNSYSTFSMATSFIVDENRFIPFAKKWYPLISEELKNSTKGKQVAYIVYSFNADSLIGKPFPVIETFNKKKEKTTVKLNTQNVYLIDYWASWCVPCIQKLPTLKKIYSTYKNKGFKILSLSIDENYEAWIKAIKEQQISWENYSSLNGINAEDTKYFNIRSIPYTILIGKNNKIIKINPTDEEVEQYLKKQ